MKVRSTALSIRSALISVALESIPAKKPIKLVRTYISKVSRHLSGIGARMRMQEF